MNYQILDDNSNVINTITASADFMAAAYPAGNYRAVADVAPPAVVTFSAYDFYKNGLTQAERIAIRALAVTDPIARDFMDLLNNAIAGQVMLHATDGPLVAGLNYLSSIPASTPCLAAGRTAVVLSGQW